MKLLHDVCWIAAIAVLGWGCNIVERGGGSSREASFGENCSRYASFKEVESAVRTWAEKNSEISERVHMFASDGSLEAQIIPVKYFGEHALDACRGLSPCAPALEYRGGAESSVTIPDVPEPFVALRLDGDFKMRASHANERLRYFEWGSGGFFHDPGVIAETVALFPSLKSLDIVLYSAPSSCGAHESDAGENTITNEVIDLSPLESMKFLKHAGLSFPTLVSNAGVLLVAGRSLDVRVSASVQNTRHLREYLSGRGWLSLDGNVSDRKPSKKAYENARQGLEVRANIVDGYEWMVVDGLFDFSSSKPSGSVRTLEIICRSAEQNSFQRMCEKLLPLLPNVEWVLIKTSFSTRSSLDLAFLRNCERLVFVGVDIENGVVLNMEGCRELPQLAGCDISFSLIPDGEGAREE